MQMLYALLAFAAPFGISGVSAELGHPVHYEPSDNSNSSSNEGLNPVTYKPSDNSNMNFTENFAVNAGADPVDTLFKTSGDQSWLAPPRNLQASGIPIPTNRWWGNFITTGTDNAEVRAWVNPFAIAMHADGIGISYPPASRVFGGASENGNTPRYYIHGIGNDVFLMVNEFQKSSPFKVSKWDDLGVTIQSSAPGGTIESTLVSGMAYVTAKYSGLTPRISLTHAVTQINGKGVSAGASTGSQTKLALSLNNGQNWVVYSSAPVTWTLDSNNNLIASGAFTGTVRIALAAQGSNGNDYDPYADCIVKGGSVKTGNNWYSFNWNTEGACSKGLLHFALTHHIDTLDKSTATQLNSAGLALEATTHGKLFPLVSTSRSWTLREPSLVPATFLPRQALSKDRLQKTNLLKVLTDDINANWNIAIDGSFYFNGKAAQKYASLCLMASDPNVVGNDNSLITKCQQKLEKVLAPFIDNTWKYPLVYDTLYRGIVSSEGFVKKDINADFGNTMYNDHHYHYGYWIAAAAIVNQVHPSYSKLSTLNARANALLRDVANSDPNDQKFPTFRMFDWYKGHSISHGVTLLADGKDQESSSEDINFHYGMTLFGTVTKNSNIATLGQLMLTLNARVVKSYFLMDSTNTIQPAQIRPNKVLGIFFDNKADYATWFSAEKYCIHGIQMIPTTPVTEFVRTKKFVQEEWNDVLSKISLIQTKATDNAWSSLLYVNYAAVDPNTSMDMLSKVPMDDGLTRSWALYMAASR
uniref:glucan endo-1,3-beta-D-glucosidase n=1 Tax=Thraustotheca clavata TaxID=74557 RepID=A0A0A7CMF3_9STRA|nr:secreted protein [Thraustotheca clavata]